MKPNKKVTRTKPIAHKNKDFYRAFEDRHRGPRELILTRLKVYLDFVEPLKTLYHNPEVLDLGCGRGEWLQLMQSNGFKAKGVDLDEGMLFGCQELNLDVYQTDALNYLRGVATESLVVVSAFHLVEHIAFDDLLQLVGEASRVLKPGGLLILETPNSENLAVGTSSFYLDPTHQRPLPASLLTFVVEHAGFERFKTLYLQESPEMVAAEHITLMNVLSGSSPDYAVVAQKKAIAAVCSLFDKPFDQSYGVRLDSLAVHYDQQRADSFGTQLSQANQLNERFELHIQWLQSEWDTSKQRVEDLSKCNGKLEAVFAAEEQKASNLASQLSQANELNGRLERHIQWLQSEWDTSKLNLGKIEVLFTAEEQKAGNLASQLNQANDQSIRQQAHAQWLQNQWNAAQVKINELNQSQQHWQTLANAYNQERKALYASYSWRITRPLRLITTGFRMLFKALLTIPLAIWWLVKWPFKLILSALIRLAIKHPALKSGIGVWLKNYPKLFTHSLLFARARGINIDATPPQLTEIQELSEPLAVENTPDLTNLTPRARRIYNDLKDAMDSNYKNKESS
jgi:SAM-dependent methyltransferase